MDALPFNRIVVQKDGVRQEMTIGSFLALPLPERVGLILGRAVEFYAGKEPIDRQEALRHLRSYRES